MTDDDPNKIATWLIKEHGPEGAYFVAIDAASQAMNAGEGYRLSIWRDVKRILTERAKQRDAMPPDDRGQIDEPSA